MSLTSRDLETGFSYYLIIDGKFYYTFGDLTLRQNADGMGTSGVSAAEFSFTVSYEEYAKNTPKSGAEVIFGFRDDDKMYCFFVSQRSRKGGTVSFKCYDRTLLLEISSDFAGITYSNVSEKDKDSGDISMLTLVKHIAEYVGFIGCTEHITNSFNFASSYKLKKADIKGKSLRSLLETISAVWCGYFTVAANNYLDFVFFGESAHTLCLVQTHAAIAMQSERSPITRVIAYTGSDYYYATLKDESGKEVEADVFSTLTVQTSFASQEYADNLLSRVQGYTYRSWQCSKAILNLSEYLPTISLGMSGYHYPDGVDPLTEFTANYLTLKFTSTGIYAEVGCNEVTEEVCAYLGYFSRKLGEKISDGEVLGNNTLITRYQGLIHLGEKEKDEKTGEVTQNRYGYSSATSDGVVKFDGAMLSKKIPEIALKSDLSGFTANFEDTSIEYEVNIDGDNVTLKEKEKDGE